MSRIATIQIRSSSHTASQFGSQLWLIQRAGFQCALPSTSWVELIAKMFWLLAAQRRMDSSLSILSPRYSITRVPDGTSHAAKAPTPWIGEDLNVRKSMIAQKPIRVRLYPDWLAREGVAVRKLYGPQSEVLALSGRFSTIKLIPN